MKLEQYTNKEKQQIMNYLMQSYQKAKGMERRENQRLSEYLLQTLPMQQFVLILEMTLEQMEECDRFFLISEYFLCNCAEYLSSKAENDVYTPMQERATHAFLHCLYQ